MESKDTVRYLPNEYRECADEDGVIQKYKVPIHEPSFKAGIREVVEQGDALLNDAYWRGKFSIGEIRQFWNQLRERCGL